MTSRSLDQLKLLYKKITSSVISGHRTIYVFRKCLFNTSLTSSQTICCATKWEGCLFYIQLIKTCLIKRFLLYFINFFERQDLFLFKVHTGNTSLMHDRIFYTKHPKSTLNCSETKSSGSTFCSPVMSIQRPEEPQLLFLHYTL